MNHHERKDSGREGREELEGHEELACTSAATDYETADQDLAGPGERAAYARRRARNAEDSAARIHDEPDPNQPWYEKMEANAMPPPHIPSSKMPGTLTAAQTVAIADVLLHALSGDRVLRHKYYNLSRTWHNNSAGKGIDGGDFTKQWLKLLADEIPDGQGIGLNVNDFANIHRSMFLQLRRLTLAVTGHDIHPNPNEPVPEPLRQIAPNRSFHWVPNDPSAPLGTYNNKDLGFPTDLP
ncbi:MAG: hypothetical protein JWM87_4187 [Candidatus Eremiobacteraeota bacterium]|nr:hypothetical protein [Candidatus Eremiobacteraeota bacterium]